jgi:hypothetical protein
MDTWQIKPFVRMVQGDVSRREARGGMTRGTMQGQATRKIAKGAAEHSRKGPIATTQGAAKSAAGILAGFLKLHTPS